MTSHGSSRTRNPVAALVAPASFVSSSSVSLAPPPPLTSLYQDERVCLFFAEVKVLVNECFQSLYDIVRAEFSDPREQRERYLRGLAFAMNGMHEHHNYSEISRATTSFPRIRQNYAKAMSRFVQFVVPREHLKTKIECPSFEGFLFELYRRVATSSEVRTMRYFTMTYSEQEVFLKDVLRIAMSACITLADSPRGDDVSSHGSKSAPAAAAASFITTTPRGGTAVARPHAPTAAPTPTPITPDDSVSNIHRVTQPARNPGVDNNRIETVQRELAQLRLTQQQQLCSVLTEAVSENNHAHAAPARARRSSVTPSSLSSSPAPVPVPDPLNHDDESLSQFIVAQQLQVLKQKQKAAGTGTRASSRPEKKTAPRETPKEASASTTLEKEVEIEIDSYTSSYHYGGGGGGGGDTNTNTRSAAGRGGGADSCGSGSGSRGSYEPSSRASRSGARPPEHARRAVGNHSDVSCISVCLSRGADVGASRGGVSAGPSTTECDAPDKAEPSGVRSSSRIYPVPSLALASSSSPSSRVSLHAGEHVGGGGDVAGLGSAGAQQPPKPRARSRAAGKKAPAQHPVIYEGDDDEHVDDPDASFFAAPSVVSRSAPSEIVFEHSAAPTRKGGRR